MRSVHSTLPARHPAAVWERRVLDGRQVVSRWVRLAVERHRHDLEHGHERGLRFDWHRGQHVVEFFHRFCKHWKGEWAGRDVRLEPWQQWKIITLYGWLRDDGFRRFTHSWEEEARKNGKSLEAAARGLYAMDCDDEPGAEVFAAATKREQVTEYVWKDAWKMVQASPDLAKRIERWRSTFTLTCEETGSKFAALGAAEDTLDALNVHMAIIDEMHAHRTRGVYDKLETGMGARRQPLLMVITTAGDETPDSPYEQLHNYAASVVEGYRGKFLDDQLFVFIAAIDETDDPFDERVWIKANPNLGVSVKRSFLRAQAEKAKNDPTFLSTFLRYHCNRRASSETAWITPDEWDACEDQSIDWRAFSGPAYGGLDLATITDLAAFALVYPDGDGIAVRCVAWCPEDGIGRRAKVDGGQYLQWAADGWLKPTPGNVIDYRFIESELQALHTESPLTEIGYDRAKAADVVVRMADAGLPLVEVAQGPVAMTGPLNRFRDLVVSGKVRHDGNPLLRWCIGNARTKDASGGLLRLVKVQQRARIDGAAAALMAFSRFLALGSDQKPTRSRYSEYAEDAAPSDATPRPTGGANVSRYGEYGGRA